MLSEWGFGFSCKYGCSLTHIEPCLGSDVKHNHVWLMVNTRPTLIRIHFRRLTKASCLHHRWWCAQAAYADGILFQIPYTEYFICLWVSQKAPKAADKTEVWLYKLACLLLIIKGQTFQISKISGNRLSKSEWRTFLCKKCFCFIYKVKMNIIQK